MRHMPSLFRLTSAGMLVLAVAACTPGGQFDPTTLLDKDMFDTKKKLQGDREPVFPTGYDNRCAARSGEGLPAAARADGCRGH
jgi:hypothetical protein